jgi:hypothetical protein
MTPEEEAKLFAILKEKLISFDARIRILDARFAAIQEATEVLGRSVSGSVQAFPIHESLKKHLDLAAAAISDNDPALASMIKRAINEAKS